MRPLAPLAAALVVGLSALAGCSDAGAGGVYASLPPLVTITSPADGAVLGGAGPFAFEGRADDPEGLEITGPALVWTSSLDGLMGTGARLDAVLTLGVHLVTLTATDPTGTPASASITVTVVAEDQPPSAFIDAPADGASLPAGAAVALVGRGVDPEDGPLGDDRLTWASDRDGALGAGGSLTVALSAGAHLLTLSVSDSAGHVATAAVGVTVGAGAGNAPPVAAIDAPADGATFVEGATIALQGHADDPEDGALPGGSLHWSSDLGGALGSGAALTMVAPALGEHQLLLTAIDSAGGVGYASVRLTVLPIGSNQPPLAAISAPAPGAAFVLGAAITFAGTGSDPEDGALGGAALAWTSDLSGPLGVGASVTRSDLAVGLHTVTLTAIDSGGASDSAAVSVIVNPPGNAPPAVTITAPADGSTLPGGGPVALQGSATDAEDGALTGAALRWTSDLAGALGTGSPLEVSGLVGTHLVTLSATDSGAATGIDQITVTFLAANTAPEVTITAPADGASFPAGAAIDFAGAASDAEEGALGGAALQWQSDLDGPMGTGAALTFASLTAGTHLVTLSAVDSGGLVGSDAVTVTVTPGAGNLPPVAQLSGPAQAIAGEPVSFDGAASSDPDGSVVAWAFAFADGSPDVAGGDAVVAHTFAAAGSYLVTLTVTDDQGATGQAQHLVEVLAPSPLPGVAVDAAAHLGSFCDLAVAGAVTHVIFRDTTHPALWYARSDGAGGWSAELVDGMGFDVGAAVSATPARLAVDAAGVVHAVYLHADQSVRYARRAAAGGWTLERVDAAYPFDTAHLAIALDPSSGQRPTVAWTHYPASSPYLRREVVATRAGAGAWTEALAPVSSEDHLVAGGLAFDAAGTAWLTYFDDWDNDQAVRTWSAAGGFGAGEVVWSYAEWGDAARLVLDPSGAPVVLHGWGVEHRLGGAWSHSDFEVSPLASFDLAVVPATGVLWAAYRHGGDLEIVSAASGDYWLRAYLGPMDATAIGADVTPGGQPRVCFFRDGNLVVYAPEGQ